MSDGGTMATSGASAPCPGCEPENPAARYAATCLRHRLLDNLPVHYFDCDRFNVSDYGLRQGRCDCTATADVEALIASTKSDPSLSEASS